MEADIEAPRLSEDLTFRVLEAMGLVRAPSPDIEGLRSLYRAWCAHVPFDNVCKVIALRTAPAAKLPYTDASDFFENWLTHGAGGTCWPGSNALFHLTRALGFRSRRLVGAMRDLGLMNHSSVVVACDGEEWLVDSSLLTNAPLPLGDDVHVHADPIAPAEVEPVDGTHLVWSHVPPSSTYLPCRLSREAVDHARCVASYEASRQLSPFNQRLYARRNRPGELVVLLGPTRFSRTREGIESRDLSPDGVRDALCDDIGVSPQLVDAWVAAGALEASFEPPTGPRPPPVTAVPPSLRGAG